MCVQVVTPLTAKSKEPCPTLRISASATIRQLHERIAEQLEIPANFEEDAETCECDCKLASQLADGACLASTFLVVHGKSNVERLELSNPTQTAVKAALHNRFGLDFERHKRAVLIGADVHAENPNTYKKPPVVAVCSKQRHTPVHARTDIDETGQRRSRVLDLHTSEQYVPRLRAVH